MSRLRGLVSERRSGVVDDVTDGTYGQPGFGSWSEGMVWRDYGSSDPMQLSAVYASQRLLSDAISTLPLDTFTRQGGVRLPYRPRPAYLDFDPPGLSRSVYLSQLMLSLLNDGNAFVLTPRDRAGTPKALIPLDPTRVRVYRSDSGATRGTIRYQIGGADLGHMDVMHIRGMVQPGHLRGLSPIAAARSVVDGATEAQRYGTKFFANASVPPAVIEVPTQPGNDTETENRRARRIAETWRTTHGGTSNAGKIGVLTGGAKLTTVAVTPEDAQWLETRRFGIQEIARIYGVPPHLIADSSNSTSWGSGLAEQNLAFGQFSLRPWIERIEEGHGRLLTTHGLAAVFIRLNLDALLRASTADRYAAHAIGLSNGFLTVDEVRALEDLPPLRRNPRGDAP